MTRPNGPGCYGVERTRRGTEGVRTPSSHQATADRAAFVRDVQPAAPPPPMLGDWAAFVVWRRLAGAAPLSAAPTIVATYLGGGSARAHWLDEPPPSPPSIARMASPASDPVVTHKSYGA